MGVTTIVAGNCGGSALDVGEALTRIEQTGVSVNYATLIGHNTIRRAVMATDNRMPTLPELTKMRSLVWRAMTDGAVGFSTGLQYVPGTYAATPELIELARVAGNAGGVYASHMRNEGTALEAAIEETIRVGEAGGCRVQISHLKVDSPSHWGASQKALGADRRGTGPRSRDCRRSVCVYRRQLLARDSVSVLGAGGRRHRIAERLNDSATWAKVKDEMRGLLAERGLKDLSFAVVASYRHDPSLNGLSMKQVAARLEGSESPDAQLEAARRMMLNGGAADGLSLHVGC